MKATGRKTEQYNFFKICNKSTNIIPGDLKSYQGRTTVQRQGAVGHCAFHRRRAGEGRRSRLQTQSFRNCVKLRDARDPGNSK